MKKAKKKSKEMTIERKIEYLTKMLNVLEESKPSLGRFMYMMVHEKYENILGLCQISTIVARSNDYTELECIEIDRLMNNVKREKRSDAGYWFGKPMQEDVNILLSNTEERKNFLNELIRNLQKSCQNIYYSH